MAAVMNIGKAGQTQSTVSALGHVDFVVRGTFHIFIGTRSFCPGSIPVDPADCHDVADYRQCKCYNYLLNTHFYSIYLSSVCPGWKREHGCSDEYREGWSDTINSLCPRTCGLCGERHILHFLLVPDL